MACERRARHREAAANRVAADEVLVEFG